MNARLILKRCLIAALLCPALLSVCQGGLFDKITGVSIPGVTRDPDISDIKNAVQTTTNLVRAAESFTPEQEYYLGRAVGANIVGRYKPWDNEKANHYVNLVGQTLALSSDLPETFGGYRFLILDTGEVNAFAAPGGLVFVTRGMLRLCQNEDDLAAVLAHEIGHVQNRHAVRAIKQGRVTSALTQTAGNVVQIEGDPYLVKLAEGFRDSVTDITGKLITSGYSQSQEHDADMAAVTITRRAGYDPAGLTRVLEAMDKRYKPGGDGFFKTHPKPSARLKDKDVRKVIESATQPVPAVRQTRFHEALGEI